MTREPRLDLTNTRKAGDSGASRFLRREKRNSINPSVRNPWLSSQ